MSVRISASLMCADLCNLARDLRELEAAGVEWLHFDVMDGHFVPNFTLGPVFLEAVRAVSDLTRDVHLMIEHPARYVAAFAESGADVISFNVEADQHPLRTIDLIRESGARPAIAINPATPVEALEHIIGAVDMVLVMTVNPGFAGQRLVPDTLEKIARVRRMLGHRRLEADVEVDGNVSFEHAPEMVARGANVLVAGTSSVFKKGLSISEGVRRLRDAVAQVSA
ncbi:MAG: ribulose-phosphate 3-epimerase [Armatimonadota bacterium]